MRTFDNINSNEWLTLVNSESHPDLTNYTLRHVNLNGQYAVYIASGYGVFLSKFVNTVEEIDEEERKVLERYNTVKNMGLKITDSPFFTDPRTP